MKAIATVILILTGSAFMDCESPIGPEDIGVLYSNSFETAADTSGWSGILATMFVDDPAPGGGQKSLLIGGGCIHPTASLDLPKPSAPGFFTISCWGKVDSSFHGGSVELFVNDGEQDHESISLNINQRGWNHYTSSTPLRYESNQVLKCEIHVGGIVFDCMKIDLLKIIRM